MNLCVGTLAAYWMLGLLQAPGQLTSIDKFGVLETEAEAYGSYSHSN